MIYVVGVSYGEYSSYSFQMLYASTSKEKADTKCQELKAKYENYTERTRYRRRDFWEFNQNGNPLNITEKEFDLFSYIHSNPIFDVSEIEELP